MFGNILRSLRLQSKLTQTELGKALHLSQRAISHYESGQRFPDENTLNLIADYFNVSIDYLLGRTNIKNIYLYLKK